MKAAVLTGIRKIELREVPNPQIKKERDVVRVDSINADCIDTTGAGDFYASGFLYGISNGLTLEKCGKIGSLIAGKVIENIGANLPDEQWKYIIRNINSK